MSIPLQDLERLMPRNGGHLHIVQALLKEPGSRLMAKIMETQALNARAPTDVLEGVGD